MKRKNTDQLLKELMDSNDLSRVLSDNSTCFREGDLPHGLQTLFDQQDMSKSALAKASGISEVYLHQVFAGRRNPSRDRLLCICVGLGITLVSLIVVGPDRFLLFSMAGILAALLLFRKEISK